MASELERFYRARAKAGIDGDYGYDNDGNLVQRDGKGTVIKTITLPTYRRPTEEEYDVMEQTHREAIAVAERSVDEARSALYAMSQNPGRDDDTMFRLNRAVMDEESKLIRIRFPLMYVARVEKLLIKQLDFTQPTNDRTVPYQLAILETRPFPLQEQYVRVGENPEMPLVSVAEAKSRIKAAEKVPVIVFEGTNSDNYGYLSLDWAITIEIDSTMYHSAKQAIYAELAKSFNDDVHLKEILATKTAAAVNYSLKDLSGENNGDEWNARLRKLLYDINYEKFKQYPALAAQLLETKNAILGAYLPGDAMIGTGISIDNLDAKDPSKWGENVLGKALMNIRDTLKESAAAASDGVAVIADEVAAASDAAPPQKKSRARPKVGTLAGITVPSMAVAQEQPLAPSAPAAVAPVEQPMVQGGATKRTLRMGGKHKST